MNDAMEHPLLDIPRDDIVPYFMWDYRYTVGQIKEKLASDSETERLWLMAKIMRDARYTDVWKFISLQDFLKYRARLMNGRLGREKGFWQFMYSKWLEHGIVKENPSNDLISHTGITLNVAYQAVRFTSYFKHFRVGSKEMPLTIHVAREYSAHLKPPNHCGEILVDSIEDIATNKSCR